MKLLLASLLTTLLACGVGIALGGSGLGGVFAVVCVTCLMSPVFAATAEPRWPPIAGTLAGTAVASLVFLVRDTIDAMQLVQLLALLLTVGLALAGLTRLLIAARVPPTFASGAVIVLALAWLGWPIWISPWVTESHANQLAPLHPLLAVNGAIPQYGLWQQSRLMYGLTSLGQDVSVGPPESVASSALFHGLIAAAAFIPMAAWSWIRRGRARTADLTSAP